MYPCRPLLGSLVLALSPALQAGGAYPEYATEPLPLGRTVWLANCEGCHGIGIAGAPVATDPAAWRDRIAQGRPVLYQHAREGHFGPGGTMMPARGGNDALSDEEVHAAVDYMLRLASDDTNQP